MAMSLAVAAAPPAPIALITCDPPGSARTGNLATQCPALSAATSRDSASKLTVSRSFGEAVPLRAIGFPRWITAWSPNCGSIAGAAKTAVDASSDAKLNNVRADMAHPGHQLRTETGRRPRAGARALRA